MDWIDNTLLAVAPRLAMRRAQYQIAAKAAMKARGYDAASTGRRMAGQNKPSTSANAETTKAPTLRNVARELERNNAWAAKAVQVVVSNVIGTGIRCQPRGSNKRRTDAAIKLWRSWAETTACDFDGRHDLYGIQALVMRTVVRDGEAIVRLRKTGTAIPLQLQVLEPDFLDTTRQSGDNGNTVIQGVEVDEQGREVACWLYEQHPGETGIFFNFLRSARRSNRVPASEYTRVFRQDRPGQLRGVTWLASIGLPLKDLADLEDARIMQQKVAASFAAFVHDASGADDLSASATDADLIESIEPGMIEYLPAGKAISFATPPSTEGFGDFCKTILHKVAAGVGITYESLTGDLSQTNFSSGRMGWIEMGRNVEAWRWGMVIPQFAVPIWAAFGVAAGIAGTDLSGVTAEHTAPRRELINPKDEIQGMQSEIRAGLTSWSEAVRERGYDPDVLLAEIAADAKRFDAAGLVLDCDPRKTTQQGQPRDKAGPGDTGGEPAA